MHYRGVQYTAKSELHVTVLDSAAGKACKAALKSGRTTERALADAFESQEWRMRRTGHFIELAESDEPEAKRSIIELLEIPAMDRFREQAARACGIDLPHAPPHVTLYVAGSTQGIPLPDDATLERLRRSEVPAEILGMT